MGATKGNIYTEKQIQLARVYKAFAHPARIAILDKLMESEECFCRDIVEEMGLAQATISQHLKELKTAGLLLACSQGRTVMYCIAPDKRPFVSHCLLQINEK
jgi:DNA-binding transcriptional ArsR family regulator